jgi:Fe-S oxidoreductase
MEKNELIAWENKCIQEESPECTSACPLHIDARLFLKEIQKGDWDAAYNVLQKTMPFPGILGRICDHPCEERCKRGPVGGPIAIGSLERHCVEKFTGKKRVQPLPRKNHRIAVLGAGLAGVTAAWDLLKKGFIVSLFEPGDSLGSSLRDLPEQLLPREVLMEELSILEALKADIRLGIRIDKTLLEQVCEEYEAVILDRDSLHGIDLSLKLDSAGLIAIDPSTGATDRDGIFAGGGTRFRGSYSPIMETLEGRKPALSIERLMQKVGLSFGRENEGPCETRLFTSLEGIDTVPRIVPADTVTQHYTQEEALAEAKRCIQCECMECVKNCLYLERYRGYPKKYAREIFNNERILFGSAHQYNVFTNSCSNCGLCETVCPNDFFVGDLCLQARRTLLELKIMPPSFHEFALQDMAHSNGDHFAIFRHQQGKEKSAWLYFPSCQLCSTSPGEVLSSYRLLGERLDGGVGIMLRCCGAPAFWAGREDIFSEAIEAIRAEWEKMGKPKVITACSTCESIFGDRLPEMEMISLWKVLEDIGLPEPNSALAGILSGKTMAIADPCITRKAPETQETVRRIVKALGIVEDKLPLSGDKPECCGYGGLMYNANPQLARDVVAHRAKHVEPPVSNKPFSPPPAWFRTELIEGTDTVYYSTTVSEHDYLAYCAMCRDNLAAAGKRTAHLIELLFPNVDGADPAGRGWISWSERRANRKRVKDAVLHELGEVEEVPVEECEKIKLVISDEVFRRIDDRRILEDDVRKVIDQAERNGKKLRNNETGNFLACYQPENVTYWVEYSSEGEGFRIHNAYCHRMKIVGIMK